VSFFVCLFFHQYFLSITTRLSSPKSEFDAIKAILNNTLTTLRSSSVLRSRATAKDESLRSTSKPVWEHGTLPPCAYQGYLQSSTQSSAILTPIGMSSEHRIPLLLTKVAVMYGRKRLCAHCPLWFGYTIAERSYKRHKK
jgi:hypothetical protein